MRRGLDAMAKNRIAMQMVDLHERVLNNQKKVMSDTRLTDLPKKQKQILIEKQAAQSKANEYTSTLASMLKKEQDEKQNKIERHRNI